MRRCEPRTSVKACLLQIGSEVVPVYGDDKSGWSIESGIGVTLVPLYGTIDELFFALVNLNLGFEGSA